MNLVAFGVDETYLGRLTSLYSRDLSSEEVADLAGCSPKVPEGDLVAWSSSVWQLVGHVTQTDIPISDYCSRR